MRLRAKPVALTLLLLPLLAVLATSSCSNPPPPENPKTPRQGASCTTTGDCAHGETCVGPKGCDAAWTCKRDIQCTLDSREFCGCDGTTFRSGSNCPVRPYLHQGPCAVPEPKTCTSDSECGDHGICAWTKAGCGEAGVCRAAACTPDRTPFCGCDGRTGYGSSCRRAPWEHEGPCTATEMAMTAAACSQAGGNVVGSIGTGALRCPPGSKKLGFVNAGGIEGAICCK